jgi:hypothetical protein
MGAISGEQHFSSHLTYQAGAKDTRNVTKAMPKRITNNGHQSSNQNPVSLELISRLSFSLFILNENRKTQYPEIEYRRLPGIGM